MIGKKLKKYRLMLEVTGETLANLAGIKRSYLSQIENEKKIVQLGYYPGWTFFIYFLSERNR